MPDKDNVIPIVDGDWFEDDIVEQFHLFLRTVFGEQHFEANLRFVNEALGVKNLRDYFIKTAGRGAASEKFYDDHVQRYKKRPIYWLFSSPRGSATTRSSTCTATRPRRFPRCSPICVVRDQAGVGPSAGGARRERDRSRSAPQGSLSELNEYEHDTLFPKASGRMWSLISTTE